MPKSSVRMKDFVQSGDGTAQSMGVPEDRQRKQLRAPRRGGVPTLTVVIASNARLSDLDACLADVCGQCARFNAELIVVRPATGSEIHLLSALYPTARFVLAPADARASELRSAGMAEANGDIVVFTDDGTVKEKHWVAQIMATVVPLDDEMPDDQRFDWPAFLTASGAFTRNILGIGER